MQTSRTRHHRLTSVALVAAIGLSANGLVAAASGGHRPQDIGAPDATFATPPSSLVTNQAPAMACVGNACTVNLFAEAGTVSAGASGPLNVWGFTFTNGGPGELGGSPNNTIVISEDQSLAINLTNHIADTGDLSIEVPAIAGAPRTCATPATCTFQFPDPGTYVYEAAANIEQPRQLAMGLSAIIVVRPADYVAGGAFATPYGASGVAPSKPFDAEALVVMNEIDPAFNNDPLGASVSDVEDYNPQYFFINGKAYPGTDEIAANGGSNVLLRVANLGIRDRAFGLMNLRMDVIGDDSHQITPASHVPNVESKLLTPGQVADVVTMVDPGAIVGAQFPVLDLSRHINNGGDSVGGMLTFIDVVADGPAPLASAPAARSVSLTDSTIADDGAADFDLNVTYSIDRPGDSAKWFLDDLASLCSGNLSGFGAGPYTTPVTIPLTTNAACGASWTTGKHVLWIQPYNSALATIDDPLGTGTASGDAFTLANDGPTISGLDTDPRFANVVHNKVDGTTDVIVTGGVTPSLLDYEITSAEVCVGAFPCFPLDIADPVAPSHTYALRAAISVADLGGVEGPVTLNVSATEAPVGGGTSRSSTSSIAVTLDTSSPTVDTATASPSPAGALGNNPGNLNFLESVRIDVSLSDLRSPIADTELFLDSRPATALEYGTGTQLRPRDGQWLDGIHDGTTAPYARTAYVEIPMAELASRAEGDVHIWIHAKDAAGNWGTSDPEWYDLVLPLDKTAPVVTNATVDTGRVIRVTANDSGGTVHSTVAKIEYRLNMGPESAPGAEACLIVSCVFLTAVVPPANTITNYALPPYTDGLTITQIFVRVQDGAGNWSDYFTVPLP